MFIMARRHAALRRHRRRHRRRQRRRRREGRHRHRRHAEGRGRRELASKVPGFKSSWFRQFDGRPPHRVGTAVRICGRAAPGSKVCTMRTWTRISRLRPTFLALALLVSAAGLTAFAQQNAAPPPPFNAQAVLPFDPAVRTGTLPNGLTYYIRRNARPEKRVALQLAVKAGSLDEADDQQGLAHFLEHMAFNGSAHFKPGELICYFESTGARLGPHVNAYTCFDETVYMLELPTDQPSVVAKGLQALADFAGGLTLDAGEIDKERGVVIEEWRGGLGAGSRMRDQQIPVLYYQSRYAERLPIGKPEILRSASAGAAARVLRHLVPPRSDGGGRRRRHRSGSRWKRRSSREFGRCEAGGAGAGAGRSRCRCTTELLVKRRDRPRGSRSRRCQLVRKRPRRSADAVARLPPRAWSSGSFEQMLNERFGELARKPDAKFLSAGAGGGGAQPDGRDLLAQRAGARTARSTPDWPRSRRSQAGRASSASAPAELDRAKKWMAAVLRARLQRAGQDRERLVRAGVRQPLPRGRAEPGHRLRVPASCSSCCPAITLDEVTAAGASAVRRREPGDSGGRRRRKRTSQCPTDAELRAALAAAEAARSPPGTTTAARAS